MNTITLPAAVPARRAHRARSAATVPGPREALHDLGLALVRAVLAVWADGRRRARVRAGIAAMRSLDDRMLADLGIGRAEIEAAARGFGPRGRRVDQSRRIT